MAGLYLNQDNSYDEYLQKWIEETIHDRLWEKYIDLHIDDIDKELNAAEYWVDASLFIFDRILKFLDISNYDIILAIPLSYSEVSTDIVILNFDYIRNELDITPPSFYLFPKRDEKFLSTIKSSIKIKSLSNNFGYYFKEEKDGDEYFRVIYITTLKGT